MPRLLSFSQERTIPNLLPHFVHVGRGGLHRENVRAFGVLKENPGHQVIFALEMAVESGPLDLRLPEDLRHSDLVEGLFVHRGHSGSRTPGQELTAFQVCFVSKLLLTKSGG